MRCVLALMTVLAFAPLNAAPFEKGDPTPDDIIGSTSRFTFHSNFWLNLHHFLYDAAKNHKEEALSSHLQASGLSEEEALILERSVGYYRPHLIDKSLLFDETMFALKRQLIVLDADDALALQALPELEPELRRAKNIYLSRVWAEHQDSNREILRDNLARIRRIEDRVFERIAELSLHEWPDRKVRVDLSYYANWAGAYTSVDPIIHAVIRSSGWESQLDFMEILFHEPTHGMIHPNHGAVADTIQSVAQRLRVRAPRNLWHGMLFYVAGTAVQEVLAEEGIEYELFMFRKDVFSRLHGVLSRHMPDYVAGEITLEKVVEKMLSDYASSPSRQRARPR